MCGLCIFIAFDKPDRLDCHTNLYGYVVSITANTPTHLGNCSHCLYEVNGLIALVANVKCFTKGLAINLPCSVCK